MSRQWTLSEPGRIDFGEDAVRRLCVRTVGGAVNVVATDCAARLELSEIEGPPLHVTLDEAGELTVTYEDLVWSDFSWRSLGGLVNRWRHRRSVVVSLAVPRTASVEVGSAGSDTVVSGIEGKVVVHGASGETTLMRLSGPAQVHSVTGAVRAQAVRGELKASTVSGELLVAEAGGSVHGNTVSGPVTLDLDHCGGTDVRLNTVSGEVAVRIPHPADATVRADTTSGEVANAFGELRLSGGWGAKRLTGRLGDGRGQLRITTVSGSVALLRRPDPEPAPDPDPDPDPDPEPAPERVPEPEPAPEPADAPPSDAVPPERDSGSAKGGAA